MESKNNAPWLFIVIMAGAIIGGLQVLNVMKKNILNYEKGAKI